LGSVVPTRAVLEHARMYGRLSDWKEVEACARLEQWQKADGTEGLPSPPAQLIVVNDWDSKYGESHYVLVTQAAQAALAAANPGIDLPTTSPSPTGPDQGDHEEGDKEGQGQQQALGEGEDAIGARQLRAARMTVRDDYDPSSSERGPARPGAVSNARRLV
jgi:hypothetical protein